MWVNIFLVFVGSFFIIGYPSLTQDIKGEIKNAQNGKPIWFDVEDRLKQFNALTPGRQDKPEQIATSIPRRIAVSNGLDGIGKSEFLKSSSPLHFPAGKSNFKVIRNLILRNGDVSNIENEENQIRSHVANGKEIQNDIIKSKHSQSEKTLSKDNPVYEEKIQSHNVGKSQHAGQIVSRQKLLRFKRSDDNPELPDIFQVGEAIGGGDCFFDSVAKGLKQLIPDVEFTVKSLRKVCKDLAVDNQELKNKIVKDARHRPDLGNLEWVIPDDSVSDDELWGAYLASIEYTSDDINQMQVDYPNLYQSLTSLKYGETLRVPIWGRPDIEGLIICQKYNVRLHLIEKSILGDLWLHQLIDERGSKSIENVDYNDVRTIHIINKGYGHFEPVLRKQIIRDGRIVSEEGRAEDAELFGINNASEAYPKPLGQHNEASFSQNKISVNPYNTEQASQGSRVTINEKTSKGNTPLHFAAEDGNLKMIKALSQGEQLTYKRKPGTAGMCGQLYEIQLVMLFLLQAVKQKEDQKIDSFYLATNMEEAGDFDDVVFKYTEKGAEKSKVVFLQAKHKETVKSEKESKVKKGKISIDRPTLLSQSEKRDFLLRKYLSSYTKIKNFRLKENHLIFKDGGRNCDFVIYTDEVVLNIDKEKEIMTEKKVEPGDILKLKDGSQDEYYYQLKAHHDVIEALRHSLDFEIFVRELAKSILSGRMNGNKPIFKDYRISLAERVIEKKNQREGRLREEFLNGEQYKELVSEIFAEIKKRKNKEKSEDELKEEFRNKNIQLPSNFGRTEESDLKLPLPKKFFSVEEIKLFLSELKLFVNQPNEGKLGEIIKQKIQSIYNVEQQDIDSVYSDVEKKIQKWWREGTEYITESNTFFQESARVSIIFDVKQPVNLFTGRTKELDDLHRILQEGGKAVISQMASVTSLGGIGKSELARKYISEHNKDYDNNVIWINSDNFLTIAESFRRLARDKLRISTTDENGKEKEIKLIVEDVYSFFAKRHRKSLFIFDNAGKHKVVRECEEAEGVEKFLPHLPNKPRVLVTSRDQDWGEIKSLPLGIFTEKEAVEFIKKALTNVVALDQNEAKRLAKELQYFPLALRQAVAYIKVENQGLDKWKKEKFTIDNYLEQFKEKASDLMSRGSGKEYDRYTETVMTTWQVTIDKIKKKKVHKGKEALKLLDVIAYLAPDKILIDEIFLKLIKDEEVRHNAVELLDKYSIANLDGGYLNIHRLVQQVTRIKLKDENKEEEVIQRALELFENNINSNTVNHVHTAWDQAMEYSELVKIFSKLPSQIISKLDDYIRFKETYLFGKKTTVVLQCKIGSDHPYTLLTKHNTTLIFVKHSKLVEALQQCREIFDKSTITKLNDIALEHSEHGKYDEALKIRKENFDKKTAVLCPDHPDIPSTTNDLATVFFKQGKYDEALQLYKEIYAKQTAVLGPSHPDTLTTMNYMAFVLFEQGKYDEAVLQFKKVFDKRTAVLGPDHPTTLTTMSNMGSVLVTQGKYDEAILQYKKVFDYRSTVLGPDHPDTLTTMNNMAFALLKQGKYNDALQLYKDALYKRTAVLGPDHPDTLTTMSNMASVLAKQAQYDESLQQYKVVFDKSTAVLGPDHPDTLTTMNNMASVLAEQGKYDEAQQRFIKIYAKQTAVLGPDHPDTLNTINNMASVLFKQGKYDEALQQFKEVLYKMTALLSRDHPETLSTMNNLALVLAEQGKYDEALQQYKVVFDKRTAVLGPDHPDTLTTMSNMALVLAKQAKYDESLQQYKVVFDKSTAVLGPDHPDTLTTMIDMASVLAQQGKYEEALQQYKMIYAKRTAVLGPDHPDTLNTINNMASVLAEQGKYNEALQQYKKIYAKQTAILGFDRPDTLNTMNNMASVLAKQGKYDEALQNYKEIYAKQTAVLGPDHPAILTTMNNMALVLAEQGKYDEALQNYKVVFDKRTTVLGFDHPSILTMMNNMALAVSKQGKYNEALQQYKVVFDKMVAVLGPDHPTTLTTMNNMALLLAEQCKYDEAILQYRVVFDKMTAVLGPDHPDTLTTKNNIATALYDQGKYDEALQNFREVFEKRTIVLGLDHPNTLKSMNSLALILLKQGKYDEALQQYKEFSDKITAVLGPDHPFTLNKKHFMAVLQSYITHLSLNFTRNKQEETP